MSCKARTLNLDLTPQLGFFLLLVVAVLCLFAYPARAQESVDSVADKDLKDIFQIHGFGGWAFGKTDHNRYLVGNDAGDFENVALSLNLTTRPSKNFKLVTQLQLQETRGEFDSELDYAFAEWSFSNQVRLRVGRVKHPFGIYTEIFDVGTLRPFLTLPQGIYGPSAFTAKTYNGLGLAGNWPVGGGWEFDYDVYAGEIKGVFVRPPVLPNDQGHLPNGIVEDEYTVEDVIGARLNLRTPIQGLMVGVSAYRGKCDLRSSLCVDPGPNGAGRGAPDYEVQGAHVEYMDHRFWIRSEYVKHEDEAIAQQEGAYAEVAYWLGSHWQVAVRYDWFNASLTGFPNPPRLLAAILTHRERGVALNYWVSQSIVVKLNFHLINGNRFAFPDDATSIRDAFFSQGAALPRKTEGLFLGTQFSF